MIELISSKNMIRNMLVSRFSMRVLTLITAVFLFVYLITGITKVAFLSMFAYMTLLSLETHNKIDSARLEIRKKEVQL